MTTSRYWLAEPPARPAPPVPAAVAFPVEAVRRDFPIRHREFNGKPAVRSDDAETAQKPRPVIESVAEYYARQPDEIVLTTLEHHANIVPWQLLANQKRVVQALTAYVAGDYRMN
jgi:selenocysteine lyase/cysteine desulfurase